MTKKMYRQGDVLIVEDPDDPIDDDAIKPDRGHAVLAYGEVTGHAHAIASKVATLYAIAGAMERVLVLKEAADLVHGRIGVLDDGDHDPVRLPAGRYRIIRQREYSPEGDRVVVD